MINFKLFGDLCFCILSRNEISFDCKSSLLTHQEQCAKLW